MVQEVAAAGDERIIISVSHSSTTQTSSLNPLKCPRCASSNTKFCYYNNYNLTQPRHFCKTCRRYWTKGGALRNVPIGGGCRKNNNKTVIPSSLGKLPYTGKFTRQYPLPVSSSHKMGKTSQGLSTNSSDHLLALLRSTQNQNPNPDQIMSNGSAGGLCLDPVNTQIMSSFWPNYEAELQQRNMNAYFNTGHYADQHNYYNQRFAALKSSENYYLDNYGAAILVGNVHASSSNSSEILESAPVVAGGESGHCWNNITSLNSWPDLPTTNGAYH